MVPTIALLWMLLLAPLAAAASLLQLYFDIEKFMGAGLISTRSSVRGALVPRAGGVVSGGRQPCGDPPRSARAWSRALLISTFGSACGLAS